MSTNSISNKLENILEKRENEKMNALKRNDPDCLPPEDFDPGSEIDVETYFEVIPNFRYAGKWWSKDRYCLSITQHSTRLVRVSDGVVDPSAEAGDYDPLDWAELLPAYKEKRRRYRRYKLNRAAQEDWTPYAQRPSITDLDPEERDRIRQSSSYRKLFV